MVKEKFFKTVMNIEDKLEVFDPTQELSKSGKVIEYKTPFKADSHYVSMTKAITHKDFIEKANDYLNKLKKCI